MNYAQARQRESDKRWDWTVRNDDDIWRAQCCRTHDDGHATAEEAERCFWEWEIMQPVRVSRESDALRKCEVCGDWTADRVHMTGDGYTSHVLCENHQNQTSYETVHPFAAGRQLMYS